MSHDLERGMIGIQARTNRASCQSCSIFLNCSKHQVDSHFLCRGLNSILNAVLRGRKMSSTGLSTSFPALASFTFGDDAPARTACFAPTLLRAEHSQSQEHNRNSGHARTWRPSMAKNEDASKLLSQRGGRTDPRKDRPEPRHDARRIRPSSAPSEHLLQSARESQLYFVAGGEEESKTARAAVGSAHQLRLGRRRACIRADAGRGRNKYEGECQ